MSGIFCYAEATFGSFGGFISGWGYWICACLNNVTCAIIIVRTLGYFIPALGTEQNPAAIVAASILLWLIFYIINQGLEHALKINTWITFYKLIPFAIFIILAGASFRWGIFTVDFWGIVNGSFDWLDVLYQVKDAAMVLLWVFVGMEGAALLNHHAISKSAAVKATKIGFLSLLGIYFILSLLPYSLLTRNQITELSYPPMAYLIEQLVGVWGAKIIEFGLIITVFGSWLSFTILPTETALLMAKRQLLPQPFGDTNQFGTPTFALLATTLLTQVFLISLLFTKQLYQFVFSLCAPVILICYLLVTIYQIKLAWENKHKDGEIRQLIIGLGGFLFLAGAILAIGLTTLLLCFVIYLVGFLFYFWARKEAGESHVFGMTELTTITVILAGAVRVFYMLYKGVLVI
jgi:arginine:ornithine antiporter/lysine permease